MPRQERHRVVDLINLLQDAGDADVPALAREALRAPVLRARGRCSFPEGGAKGGAYLMPAGSNEHPNSLLLPCTDPRSHSVQLPYFADIFGSI